MSSNSTPLLSQITECVNEVLSGAVRTGSDVVQVVSHKQKIAF